MFHHLPVDLIRHVYKMLLIEDPLQIFTFDEEMFIWGDYKKEEKEALIIDSITRFYNFEKVPLFENIWLNQFLSEERFKNKIYYLDLISNKNLIYSEEDNLATFILLSGNKEILEWFKLQKDAEEFKWSSWCYNYASKHSLEMLKWLCRESNSDRWEILDCYYSIQGNNFQNLKWLRQQNPPCPWDKFCCEEAVRRVNFKMLKWMRTRNPPCPWDKENCLSFCKWYIEESSEKDNKKQIEEMNKIINFINSQNS
jgi:hypothetical protein